VFDLPLWKRVLAVLGLSIASVWIAAMSLQTIAITCAPGPTGAGTCVHEVRYAGITARTSRFTPSVDRISPRSHGKGNGQGTVDIRSDTGEELEITWLSSDEARSVAERLVREPSFAMDSTGPRWWLLFLVLTGALIVSLVVPTRTSTDVHGGTPIAQTRKTRRAERGRAAKAAQTGKRHT
jgi:hypothetical protein